MGENSWCYFHPKEELIGICPLCLNERLLLLAAKQAHHHPSSSSSNSRKTSLNLPKIFAFSSLLSRHWRSDHSDITKSIPSSSSSPEEESFISIKFEDNGAALWEKGINGNVSNKTSFNPNFKQSKQGKDTSATMSVIEHTKPRGGSLRWRKRIDHLFQVIKRKRSNRANVCHVSSKAEGVKVMRKSWIRILTRRRTKE
ncbi:uncharacterized protein [Euphorbia lathyris]|uniref:uncharacterized protein n=1 Tax=Euphorbia lathyris TaxID=212925 RepID=UPI003313D590